MQAHILVDGRIERTTSAEVVREAHAAGRRMWINLEERSPSSDRLLSETFHIHPLVIEDIWVDRPTPKIDDYDDYLYVVIHGPRRAPEGAPSRLELWELDILLGKTFVITQHGDAPLSAAIEEQLARSPALLEQGIPWVVHALLDHVVDRYLPVIELWGERLDRVERDVVTPRGDDDEDLVPVIFALKRSIQELCRITGHQLRILERLSRSEFDAIPKPAIPYFRDVHDHFLRVADLADTYHDVVVNALDTYLGLQSHRMNQTMKTLTLMSTVMLPLNLIAGIYGMNFHLMPELSWRYGYPVALGLMGSVAAVILLWFKRRSWL